MREKFIEELIKEVYGPREGPTEKIYQNPLNEYITGVIVHSNENEILNQEINNKDNLKGSEDSENDLNIFEDYSEDDVNEEINPLFDSEIFPSELDPRLRIKSFGFSFVLNSKKPKIDICVTWSRYFEKCNEETVFWERTPYCYILEDISLENELNPIKIFEDENGGKIFIHIKLNDMDEEDSKYITISLVNKLKSNSKYSDTNFCIFQPSIRINIDENSILPNITQINEESDDLSFIYRNRPVKAIGHMCSVIWNDIDYYNQFKKFLWPDGDYLIKDNPSLKKFFTPDIRSEFVPLHPIPSPSFDIFPENNSYFDAKVLSECWDNTEIEKQLILLINNYEKWITNQENKQKNLDSCFDNISQSILKKQKEALKRINEGLKILLTNENAKLAFCFANKTISLQFEWNKKGPFRWRAFQIAFFLMTIESLVNKDSKYRDTLDLLWISTGGGKTEAYLAIMIFTMVYRRLTNDNYGGTSIISRYTLRLLTVQQFRRTLSVVTAAEYLRVFNDNNLNGWRPKKCAINDDWIYGRIRFSIGMWVGSKVTPNHLRHGDNAAMKILEETDIDNKNSDISNPAQVFKCPVCGNWLSIPFEGLPKNDNNIHIVVKKIKSDISSIIKLLEDLPFIKKVRFTNKNHLENYFTLSFYFHNSEITSKEFNKILNIFKDKIEIASLSIFNLGYFASVKENRSKDIFSNFEIYCTNPSCDLNNTIWSEIPYHNKKIKEKEYFQLDNILPFEKDKRMPIPAYTVDEQVYCRCPTIIIATADKIARLPFEPLISLIFGNVNLYNKYYGYNNSELIERLKDTTKKCREEVINIKRFESPDLIIQDELHLIEGPLGSLFGIYEIILNAIINKNNGKPKYIASSATIKNAKEQCNLLFAKDIFQFPPYGLNVEDNFFVKEESFNEAWDDNKKGRVYMGIYAPGRGPMTPQVRLWSNILKTSNEFINEDNILYYWSIVGYYNAIRELGGGVSLYKEDIEERLSNHSDRKLNLENFMELSSRLPSTIVPIKLNELEADGNRNINEKPSFDAIFTTSMFGTGVDISHLSLMIVNGQPKTTGSYIQATGRIGREFGGLVVTFLKAGRPRDLNHYESFPTYHYRVQTSVEPVSVSPFSKGCLEKSSGSSLVSFLRNNMENNLCWIDNPLVILDDESEEDINDFFSFLKSYLKKIQKNNKNFDDGKIKDILLFFEIQVSLWKNVAKKIDDEEDFVFNEYAFFKPKKKCCFRGFRTRIF